MDRREAEEALRRAIAVEQAWVQTVDWETMEREADEDIAAGRLVRYDTDVEFLAALGEEAD